MIDVIESRFDSHFQNRSWVLGEGSVLECVVCKYKQLARQLESYEPFNATALQNPLELDDGMILVTRPKADQMVAVTTSDFLVKRELSRPSGLWIMAPDMQLCCSKKCLEMYLTVGFLP